MRKSLYIVVLAMAFVACQNTESGSKIGILTTVSYNGKIWKSHEVTLKCNPNFLAAQGAQQGVVTSSEWDSYRYSIDNDGKIPCETPLDSIKAFRNRLQLVELHYQKVAFLNWWNNRGERDYFVTKVTPLK